MLVVASLLVSAAAVISCLGIQATPSETTDSQGRPMGFNDPLSAEHYLIIAQHFRLTQLFKDERWYEWLLFAMHGAGLWLLLSKDRFSPRFIRWFFAAQPAVFPLGADLLLGPTVGVHQPADCSSGS